MMADLLKKPFGDHGNVHQITPESAGWRYVGFSLYRLREGESVSEVTGDREVILVMVEGKATFTAAGKYWGELGERMSVFEKTPPHCLYVPNDDKWEATATTECTIAVCSAPGIGGHEARRIGPDGIELMGWIPPPDGIAMCQGDVGHITDRRKHPWNKLPSLG